MKIIYSRPLRLVAALGAIEQQNEAYLKYGECAAQFATTCSTKSSDGVVGSANKQVAAARMSE